jgi:molybdopterin-synthase adenylyltransferase
MAQNTRRSDLHDYLRRFAAQTPALSRRGQRRLRAAHVAVIGAGGIGSMVCVILASLGVGKLTVIDPQPITPDNFNRFPWATDDDLGRAKVSVLRRLLRGRAHLRVQGLRTSCDAAPARRAISEAHVVVSASNDIAGRVLVARLARQYDIAHVFAGVSDARAAYAGTIGAWVPERPDLACQGCYLTSLIHKRPRYGEALVATLLTTVSGLAAHAVLELLVKRPRECVVVHRNMMHLTLDGWALETAVVRRHPRCDVCRSEQPRIT